MSLTYVYKTTNKNVFYLLDLESLKLTKAGANYFMDFSGPFSTVCDMNISCDKLNFKSTVYNLINNIEIRGRLYSLRLEKLPGIEIYGLIDSVSHQLLFKWDLGSQTAIRYPKLLESALIGFTCFWNRGTFIIGSYCIHVTAKNYLLKVYVVWTLDGRLRYIISDNKFLSTSYKTMLVQTFFAKLYLLTSEG